MSDCNTKERIQIETECWNKFNKERSEYISENNQLKEDRMHLGSKISQLEEEETKLRALIVTARIHVRSASHEHNAAERERVEWLKETEEIK